MPERIEEVDFILTTIDRNPLIVNEEKDYIEYLGNATLPLLLTDDKVKLTERIKREFPNVAIDDTLSLSELKELLSTLISKRKEATLAQQIKEIKDYRNYEDIQHTFEEIKRGRLYDSPLMLEWNTWRAMTMLDGGNIVANLRWDDFGQPLYTAQGNMADIVCDYGDFNLLVEVTMASGQKQYEMEGESIGRHLGKHIRATGKTTYVLFVAPTINESVIAYFFMLQRTNIIFYGGYSIMVPLPLHLLQKMLEDSYKAAYLPNPSHVRRFMEKSHEYALLFDNEQDWYEAVLNEAINWLGLNNGFLSGA
ncbi:MAG: AlwI family type II restriction endonuclease [Bacteroidales bacterium]|nr:AlwI family type II restriction endonuclease [Bacteroidales bacterium]